MNTAAVPKAKARFLLRDLPRLTQILRVLAAHGWGHYLERLRLKGYLPRGAEAPAPTAAEALRLRLALEELGPTFVKFGQALSVRQDLFPEDVIAELRKLQDAVPPFPASAARAIVEEDLGRPLAELFAAFEDEPLAAASIAQVHHAQLPDGTAAIVKVQRPGIEGVIRADVEILRFLAGLLQRYAPQSRRYDPIGLVEEFAETIARELDFLREGRNAERFAADLKQEPSVYVPRVFWELSSRRVLTMEHSPGRRMDADYPQPSEQRVRVARALATLLLIQLLEHGFFHGDLHPGNVFLLADGRLCFHDFGIVGRLSARDQEHLRWLLLALLLRDASAMADLYFEMGVASAAVDRTAFVRDLDESLEQYYAVSGREFSFAEILRQYIRLGGRYEIRMPRELLLVAKVFMQVESLARVLDPTFDMLAALREYLPRMIARELAPPWRRTDALARGYRALSALREGLPELPQTLAKVLRTFGSGELRLRHERLEELQAHLDRASNRLSFSLIIGAIVIGSSIVMAFHAGPHYEKIPVLGLIGYVIAAVLGLAWAVAILRSGRF